MRRPAPQKHHQALLQQSGGGLALDKVEQPRQAANCLQTLMERLAPPRAPVMERAQQEMQRGGS